MGCLRGMGPGSTECVRDQEATSEELQATFDESAEAHRPPGLSWSHIAHQMAWVWECGGSDSALPGVRAEVTAIHCSATNLNVLALSLTEAPEVPALLTATSAQASVTHPRCMALLTVLRSWSLYTCLRHPPHPSVYSLLYPSSCWHPYSPFFLCPYSHA